MVSRLKSSFCVRSQSLLTSVAKRGKRWTEEEIVAAIRAWYKEHGKLPTSFQWNRAGKDHPGTSMVLVVMGSWNEGIKAAGFVPRSVGHQRGAKMSPKKKPKPKKRPPRIKPTIKDPKLRQGERATLGSILGDTVVDDSHSTNTPAENKARVARMRSGLKP